MKRVRAGAGEHSRVLVPCLVAQPLESDRTVNLDPQLRLSEPLMRERQFLPPWHIHRATGSKLQQSAYASSRFSRLSPPRSRTIPKSLRSRVAIRRSPCTWATQSSEASARSIGKLPYCRIQPAINSRADPLSSAPFRPPSDTKERKRGAMSAGIRWQTSVRTGQVDTKAPLCLRKKAAQMPWSWSLRSNQATHSRWCRLLGPHWKSCRSVRGLPPEPPGWWSAVATSQGQPCSEHHRLAQDFVADQGMQGCLFCDIHSSVASTQQPSRSSRSWRRLIIPRSECSGERSTSRSPLASTSPTAAAAGQKTCTAIGAGRLSWLERKSQQPAGAVAQGGLAQRWPPGAPLPAQPLGPLASPQRAATG